VHTVTPGAEPSRHVRVLAGAVALGLVATLHAVTPAAAEDPIEVDDPPEVGEDGDWNQRFTGPPISIDPAGVARAAQPSGPPVYWAAIPRDTYTDDPDFENEGYCRGWRYVAADSPEEAAELEREGQSDYNWLHLNLYPANPPMDLVRPHVDCPPDVIDPAEVIPPVVLRSTVRTIVTGQLPRPELAVPPGYALAGLPAYLVTGDEHDLTHSASESVSIGPLELTLDVTATGSTTVDWGDGSAPTTHGVPGQPYPDGEIRHTYTDRDTVDITVTDSWDIAFDVSGAMSVSDTVSAELAEVVYEGLEVREMRPVRLAPPR
jgi:hypothetical protein